MNKIILVIGGLVVLGVAVYALTQASSNQPAVTEQSARAEKAMMDEKAQMEQTAMDEKAVMETEAMTPPTATSDEAMMKKEMQKSESAVAKTDESAMMKKDSAMMSHGSYQLYTVDKLALAQTGKVVLFFKASWCPSCKTVDADIKANLSAIPANLTILEVDYDTSAALKQKYGVTYQHTFVQVDSAGTLISKWSGSPTLADISTKVK